MPPPRRSASQVSILLRREREKTVTRGSRMPRCVWNSTISRRNKGGTSKCRSCRDRRRRRPSRSSACRRLSIISLWPTIMVTAAALLCASSRRSVSAFVAVTSARSSSSLYYWSKGRTTTQRPFLPRTAGAGETTTSRQSQRWLSSSASSRDEEDDDVEKKNKKTRNNEKRRPPSSPSKKKKFKVVEKITDEHTNRLAAAFDELAKKEGFDSTTAFYADDATFEDEFLDDDDDDEDFLDDDEDSEKEEDFLLDPLQFDTGDFVEDVTDNTDDIIDDMEARIASAKQDVSQGRVTVSQELEDFAETVDLRQLGFRREVNPFGNDETPRRQQFQLVTNAMSCSACGADFQCTNDQRPGYLPPEKFDVQVKLSKIEEMQRLQEKARSNEWSAEDEVEWLLQTANDKSSDAAAKKDSNELASAEMDIDAMAEELGLDLVALSQKKTICKRCHGLQNFGKVDESLRPGWTKEPLLSQESFRELLRPIGAKPAVIVALVDLFDFAGSVLPELDNIAGNNPVILAANKADLLPSKMGPTRAENWVRRELEHLGIKSLANGGGAVRLVSCKTGAGVAAMLDKARSLAEEMDCDIYVVGAANAGKSTLLNHILGPSGKKDATGKKRAGNRNKRKAAVTTSPLPGTTLKFIRTDLGGGRSLYDTPGLLVPGTLTQLLTPEELKIVVPKSQVEPITFRLAAGKCVLVGGLARIELVGDSKPFLFTFYVANAIKLHPTDASKADEFIKKHAGEMLIPPLPPGPERMDQLGEFEEHNIVVEGTGWKEAAADITLTGLGWVAATGAGTAQVRVRVPKGVGVSLRPPLMPFDVWDSTAKYTGSHSVRKSSKTKSGKRRKGVGRN